MLRIDYLRGLFFEKRYGEMSKKAIIIGAGPAGLTAAYELLMKTDIIPVILEQTSDIGGISKTVIYKGNRMDIGGHRFFSKSDRVMNWWLQILPLQKAPSKDELLLQISDNYLNLDNRADKRIADPEKTDKVMLIRNRMSRILYLRRFFNYPLSIGKDTLKKLGFVRIFKIGISYLYTRFVPIKNEKSLEDFFINRFGRILYKMFFKDYTEKVWGVPCSKINPEWGAQRIKGLSVTKAIQHAVKNLFGKNTSLYQKKIETSLIERFMYPKYGPGQMWETVACTIKEMGGIIIMNHNVMRINFANNKIISTESVNLVNQSREIFECDYVFSTMPVKDLINAFDIKVPPKIMAIADGLVYRDFITIGLLLHKLKITNETQQKTVNNIIPDNWIYIQEQDVKVARLQIFNNWSPYMVEDLNKVWIGLEYLCFEGDAMWNSTDDELKKLAIEELSKLKIIDSKDVIDSNVIRMAKTYPAYFGTYDQFHLISEYTDKIENLFLIGRNGMHKYNNQDHSMLTAMVAVENIIHNIKSKANIWEINTEKEYHETK
jgi:protoporphyrinogen oxidase